MTWVDTCPDCGDDGYINVPAVRVRYGRQGKEIVAAIAGAPVTVQVACFLCFDAVDGKRTRTPRP